MRICYSMSILPCALANENEDVARNSTGTLFLLQCMNYPTMGHIPFSDLSYSELINHGF